MKVTVQNIIGPRCITSEDGQKLYETIRPVLASQEDVYLDFSGISAFSSPFFNFAIGQLYKDLSSEILNLHLKPENLNGIGHKVLRLVLKNSKAYYENPTHRQAVDHAVQQLSEMS